jgi:kumamolisin
MLQLSSRPALVALGLIAGSFLSGSAASAPEKAILTSSIKAVAAVPTADPNQGYETRSTLTASEQAETVNLEVPLQMHNFDELESRVAAGEKISSQELAAKYEPSAADYQQVETWLTSQGLTVTREDGHHIGIFVRGTVAQIQKAMSVTFAKVSVNGTEYTSAVTAPTVPGWMSSLVIGVNGLQPHIFAHKHSIIGPIGTPLKAGAGYEGVIYTPAQIAAAYNATPLYTANLNGSGQTIAIIIDTFPLLSDLTLFWKKMNVPQSLANITLIQTVAGPMGPPTGEETLDTSWSSSMAPGAKIRVYGSTSLAFANVDTSLVTLLNDVTTHPEYNIHQMSMSFGLGEQYYPTANLNTDEQYFAELTTAGVTCFASTGDHGATPDAFDGDNGPLQVSFPSSGTDVTAVGGTSLHLNKSTNTVNSEVVWNDALAKVPGATGGGTSIRFTRPGWQTGPGVSLGSERQVPDISSSADLYNGATLYLDGLLFPVGGTSWSSPTCAGFCALWNQALNIQGENPIGLLGPDIYPLIETNNFRDITSGNNATPNSNGLYKATVGYDEASGIGAPLVTQLAETLTGSNTLVGVSSAPPIVEVTPGTSTTLTVGVTGSSATYQWQEMILGTGTWVDMSDGTPFSGTATASLVINPVSESLSGDQFRCEVTLTTSTQDTDPTTLVVDNPLQITTLAGAPQVKGFQNTAGYPGRNASFRYPQGVAVDAGGNIFVADTFNNVIRKITPAGVVSTAYGSVGGTPGNADGTGTAATFNAPVGLAFDPFGNLFVADSGNGLVREITNGVVSTFADLGDAEGGIATDSSGDVFVSDTAANEIDEIPFGGSLTVLAGAGAAGYLDGSDGVAEFDGPAGLAVDSLGDVFVADSNNNVIREIAGGTVTTVAGQAGIQGDLDGDGTSALFNMPIGLCVDPEGNVYITDATAPISSTDSGNNLIRKLSNTGVVSTLAGNPGNIGATNGVGSAAEFFDPTAIAFGGAGNFYIADTYNQEIRQGTPTAKALATVTLSGLATTYDGSPQPVTVTTIPSGLDTTVTYNGSGTVPTNAGTYAVVATVDDPNYSGSASGTYVIAKETATVTLGSLNFNYTGLPQPATATTTPAGLTVNFTYNGTTKVPVNDGSYAVVATINDPNYQGTANGTEVITTGVATITLGPLTFNYNGQPHPVTVTVLPKGVATTVTYNGSTTAPTAIGSYTVVATVTTPGFTGSATATENILPIAPTAATGIASAITGSNATLSGTVNPEGSDTTVYFQYGTTTGYGSTSASQDVGSGTSLVVSTETIPFAPSTSPVTYHYRVVATSVGGTTNGPDRTFVSIPEPVITNTTTSLSATGAELTLSVNPDGAGTTVYIQYGPTTSYGNTTARINVGNGTKAVNLYFLLPTLSPSTLYYYQVVMVSPAGTFTGPQQTFTTLGFDTTLVAASGQSAPGTLTTFATFGPPAVNANDGAAFNATLALSGSVTKSTNDGIWADSGGTLDIVTTTGGFAPGTTGAFQSLSDPAYNDNSAVAFHGTGPGNVAGIWNNVGGSVALTALQGAAASGTTGVFSTFGPLGLTNSAGPVFYATISGAGISGSNNAGIWEGNTAGTLAVQLGQTVDSKTISALSFMPSLAIVNGQTRSFNANGDLACLATFTDRTTGFVQYVTGAPFVATYSGLPADDLTGPTYASFGNPAINNNEHLAYQATITGTGVTRNNNSGIWADNSSGTRTLVAQTGTLDAPGTTSVFSTLGDPVINNNEAVAFMGTLASSRSATGIWATGSNLATLALVAQTGGAAPGCPGATFNTFSELVLPDVGGTVFVATLNNNGGGVSSTNNLGVWGVDNTGTLQLIVRTGDILNGKTITALSILSSPAYVNGQDRSFSASTGDLVYLATFSDKSTAIFNVVFP